MKEYIDKHILAFLSGMIVAFLATALFFRYWDWFAEWMHSGIGLAIEASGPRMLVTIIQLGLFISAAFGGGLYFGRYWLSKIIANKDSTIANKESEITVISRAVDEQKMYSARLQLIIDSSDTIEAAQNETANIPEPTMPDSDLVDAEADATELRRIMKINSLSIADVAKIAGIHSSTLDMLLNLDEPRLSPKVATAVRRFIRMNRNNRSASSAK